ncbi:MAG: hypothetical protein A2340_07440 [Lentisphaerae bacterium RIFOXYB12_FULL_60_10]|nr:MAG: hypothetical protein A2340_07440 [Lentisphaerae bacterium RIFOXYB12_FULL_60_10]
MAGFCFAAGTELDSGTNQPLEAIQVIDIVIVSSNYVTLGTNTMSLEAATNVIARHRDTVDVIAVHGSIAGNTPAKTTSSTVADIARAGVPMVFVEQDEGYVWRRDSAGANGVRTVHIGTDQYAALRQFWTRGKDGANPSSMPVLQTTVDADTATGSFALQRIELGFFGKRVWLMHEQREPDDKSGTMGIRLQRDW